MRPIYHPTASRLEAHIFIASLAFWLDRALEKKLKSAGLDLFSHEAWQTLKIVPWWTSISATGRTDNP